MKITFVNRNLPIGDVKDVDNNMRRMRRSTRAQAAIASA